MNFYQALAEYYDEIFPLKAVQKTFLHDYLVHETLSSVLDVGCGTGSYALELSQTDVDVLGVDLSEEMIDISKGKAIKQGSNALFAVADMLDLSGIKEQFDGIFCLGNTLAHVFGECELKQALTQFRERGSHLLLQAVNYDRIFAKQVKELPTINTSKLTFYRYYSFRSDGRLDFSMKIELKDTNEVVSGVNRLFPLKYDILKSALLDTGWEISGLWGNFEKQPWTEDSPATILAAKRIPR